MRRIVIGAIAAAILAFLGWRIVVEVREGMARRGSGNGPPAGRGPARAVAVEVRPVARGPVRDVRLFTGTLLADSEFEVAPKVSGILKELTVRVGDQVKRGQLIARIDDDEIQQAAEMVRAELQVAQANVENVRLVAALEDEELAQKAAQVRAEVGIAQASVQEARSTCAVAEREYERVKALHEKKILSQSELEEAEARSLVDQARLAVAEAQVAQKEAALRAAEVRLSDTQKQVRETDIRLAEARVAERQAALRSAEVQLGYTTIRADWPDESGTRFVGERYVDEGAMLTAHSPILSIVDIGRLRARIFVIERDYPLMAVGQRADVTTDAYPDTVFEGLVTRIATILRESSRQALVEVEIDNRDGRLKPGMFVRLEIEFSRQEDAVLVPREALVTYLGQNGVFRVDPAENKAVFAPVRTGIVTPQVAQIVEPELDGLVVTLGHHILADGSPVLISEFSAKAVRKNAEQPSGSGAGGGKPGGSGGPGAQR